MNLVQVTHESIMIGQPLAFSLRDETGALLARKGFVIVSRDDLESLVWGFAEENSGNSLEVHIANLRRKIGRNVIETVRGLGYRVNA